MKTCCLSCACSEKRYLPQRYVLAILCFCGLIAGYGQRVSINLAITVMTDKNVTRSESCPSRNITRGPKKNITGGVIDWSNEEQNWIIGAFFSGYVLAHLPAGHLCDKFGGRPVFLGGIAVSTVLTVVTPIIVTTTPFFVTVLLRIVIGLGQAVIYPAISTLYARWVPLEERSLLGAFSMGASAMGVIIGNAVTGGVIFITRDWPSIFYMWALIGVVWSIVFAMYVYSEPAIHRSITDDEKAFLLAKIVPPSKTLKTPWLAILTSLPVWGLVCGEVGHGFTLYTLMNSMPKYLSDVLQYDIEANAVLSSIPYPAQWFGALAAGKLADYLIHKKDFPVAWMRRIMTTIGLVASPAFLVLGGYMRCNGNAVVAMFTLSMLLRGPFFAGLKVNHLEMTVNFPGIVMAIYNGLGAVSGQISPIMISAIAHKNTLEQWLVVFWIIFAISTVMNVIYCVVCTDKRLKWDIPEDEREAHQKSVDEEQAKRAERKAQRKAAKANRAATA